MVQLRVSDGKFLKVLAGIGSGTEDVSALNDFVGCRGQIDRIGNMINNTSLGSIPDASHTMFIRYRVGGGNSANIGPNVLTQLGVINFKMSFDVSSYNSFARACWCH